MENIRKWCFFTVVLISVTIPTSYGNKKMDISSMHIESQVTSRFARTFITAVVKNLLNSSEEAIFHVELPKTAFITDFSMTVDNVTTVGSVKRKEEAKTQYQKAVSKGQSAGLVQSTGRKMENFQVSVNVGALSTVIFKLTYEELLKRQLGNYELYLKVKPKELVENFQINVDIIEPQGISFLKAVGTFISNELTGMVKVNLTENKAHIEFKPTVDQQRNCPNCLETLLDGDLIIKYDVKRDNSAGKVQIVNGYFVHYFAPASLKRMPKNVMFVIDRSGSMYGNKIKQTHEAFIKILEDVPTEDTFGIVLFDDKIDIWKRELVKATPSNIKMAKTFVSSLNARGGTDINKALIKAAEMLKAAANNSTLPAVRTSLIIFLSDGDPTSGITDHNQIIRNVKESLGGLATLYCLGFGNDVDYNLLEKLALENGGLARRIYEDSDSALQLQGFYNEVAYPMLLDINLQYLDNSVEALTQSSFRHYYQGSEIIVAGRIASANLVTLKAQVTGQGVDAPFSKKVRTRIQEKDEAAGEQSYIFGDFTERLWAYLTIEQLLTQQISVEGEEKHRITEKALNLSLKYNFVTPLTSMVVTPPEEDDKNKQLVANKPREGDHKDSHLIDHHPVGHDVLDYDEEYHYDHHSPVHHALPPSGGRVLPTNRFPIFDLPRRAIVPTTPIATTSSTTICDPFYVLIRGLHPTEKMCIEISKARNAVLNLFHDASTGITINSKLAPNEFSFVRFGLLHSRMRLKVDVTNHSIAVTHDADVQTYDWNSSFEKIGFLKKDGEKILVTTEDGATMTIFQSEEIFYLSLDIDNTKSSSNNTIGIIGQLLRDDKIHFRSNHFVAGGQELHLSSFTDCDFSSYGDNPDGSCLVVRLGTNELDSGASNIIPDIFHVPQ
ncbi:inter-alpha-trypsin inhibitor heavy chain H3-like isoform X2 [Mixophyes fleayi]|uniref:inter-alpha-trypsin inhibitor heavy chain H3-like isoform X2 n=1 Tax=Mixophyes fleayi TaxID=3061075 RepID=UPI003F4D7B38